MCGYGTSVDGMCLERPSASRRILGVEELSVAILRGAANKAGCTRRQ